MRHKSLMQLSGCNGGIGCVAAVFQVLHERQMQQLRAAGTERIGCSQSRGITQPTRHRGCCRHCDVSERRQHHTGLTRFLLTLLCR